MSRQCLAPDPDEEDIEHPHPTRDTDSSNPYSHGSSATRIGLYGSYRLIPGLTTLSCKCAERDLELSEVKERHENAINALTKGHAEIISHLNTEFQEKMKVQTINHEKKHTELVEMVHTDLEDRLHSAFRYLDTSWAKQTQLMKQEHASLVEALLKEHEKEKLERDTLERREKLMEAREHDLKASKNALTKNVRKRRAELLQSQDKLLRLKTVLSLVDEYHVDCMVASQLQADQYYIDAQDQAQVAITLADQEAQSIVEAAQKRAEEILQQAQDAADLLVANVQRRTEALALEGSRRSPTLSDVSTSGYSLRSFDSLPILEESHAEEQGRTVTPNGLSRRASFDAGKKRRLSKRKPIPFNNGIPAEFGLEMGNAVNTPAIGRGQRKRTVSTPLSDGTYSPFRKGEGNLPERSKAWKPY